MSRQFLLFCVSGTLAFMLDAGVLHSLVAWAGLDPFSARLLSVLLAMTFTWVFNRQVTFAGTSRQPLLRQWLHYLATQTGGMAVNYTVYSVTILAFPLARAWPVIGVAAGSIAGLLVNYSLAKRWVFKHRA